MKNFLILLPSLVNGFKKLSEEEKEKQLKDALPQAHFDALQEKFGAIDGYHWRINNWGVKWDLHDIFHFNAEGDSISVDCLSAWAPPEEALKTITKLYPGATADITYSEGGNDFYGRTILQNGETTFLVEGSISELMDKWAADRGVSADVVVWEDEELYDAWTNEEEEVIKKAVA